MYTHLCRFQLPNHFSPQPRNTTTNRGQIIVIFAVSLLALIFITGLAIDSGSLYVTYGQMRRAVDAAAVAAANDYKAEGVGGVVDRPRMEKAALEVMNLHDVHVTPGPDFRVYLCDEGGNPPEFQTQCPDTTLDAFGVPKEWARKLVWIDATQNAPVYFLSLLGFSSIPLRAHAIAEAAPIDLVIVIDTSESMANATAGYSSPYDPTACNATNTCDPLNKAKAAARTLIDTLYDGYDHVAIVGYDVTAPAITAIPMQTSLLAAKADVSALRVHDDPPYNLIQSRWFSIHPAGVEMFGFNPVYPEDRDGNGVDADPGVPCTLVPPIETAERWDATINTFGLDENGTPCDNGTKFDSYDWDADGVYTDNDDVQAKQWLLNHGCDITNNPGACRPLWTYFTPNSTCTGCGIRAGAEVLKRSGRPNAVWVMVFLSDGLVNLSDTPATNSNISGSYPNGFCTGGIGSFAWGNDCLDTHKNASLSPRYCLDNPSTTCPPGSISALGDTTQYSVYDYALDMVDYAALQRSANAAELSGAIAGSDIAIYAVGLGGAGDVPTGASGPIGEYLLRYLAAVGDDGERLPDPCNGIATRTNCGQYYYTATGTGLGAIFNEISTRIYSRLTQ